ncbi:multicopper oxidase family protein [Oscillatoria sp. FACHB-1406]|uniref:multicopper oxidase family protein n=1 Tax=Oscillatoria sp. FACHB-1406 TaxID=2692846 RepID=UPI0016855BE3|nr:multicopper oxidase family protein [Oscillatoria sp. FACHB-1406]MBD2578138.1 multicopper oxidase family protein [Oscillatoria sp. FACHB-1406]
MKLTRREAIRLGIVGGGGLLLPFGYQPPAQAQFSPQVKRFDLPFRRPPLLQPVRSDDTTDYYEITMQKSRVEILPGKTTEIWGYNGMTPGPLIRQKGGKRDLGGRQSIIRFINQLGTDPQGRPIKTSVHLHGMASLPQYDGYAEDLTAPGQYKDYIYPNERPATLWYHDHAIDLTSRNAYMGLAGMYIVEDDYELTQLNLPQGEYDVPLILQDKRFATDGSFIFDDRGQKGLFGDIILVNGVPWPHMEVANRKYRFRLLNASVSRGYQLALSTGDDLIVIGTDAGLRGTPLKTKNFEIFPAERYEFIIDFSKYPVGTQIVLRNLGVPLSVDYSSNTQELMRFEVVRRESDDSTIPAVLRDFKPIDPALAVRTRTFRLERNINNWTINGRTWNKNRSEANPNYGDIEIWNLVSTGGWFHPIHIHLLDMQLLARNGSSPRPYEIGWKDVFYVGEFQTVQVIGKFGPQIGRYMMHCHNLVHEDHAMMAQFEVGQGGYSPFSAPPKSLPATPL